MRGGITAELGEGTLLDSLLPRAVELVGEFHEADLAGVAERGDDNATIKVSIARTDLPGGDVAVRQSPPSTTDSMNAYALTEGLAVVTANLADEERFSDALLAEHGVASAMVVPIVVANKPVGTLGIYWTQGHRFVPADAEAAEAIARLLATKVSRAGAVGPEDAGEEGGPSAADVADPTARTQTAPGDDQGVAGGEGNLGGTANVEETDSSGKALRRSARLPFQHWQRIGPIDGGMLPTLQQLYKVECRDLSNGGISFYLPERPQFDSLVVALGAPPDEKFFTARVVRVIPENRDGREIYQLGCQFMGRVYL